MKKVLLLKFVGVKRCKAKKRKTRLKFLVTSFRLQTTCIRKSQVKSSPGYPLWGWTDDA